MLPDPLEQPCLSAEEAFSILGIDRKTGYRAIKERAFPVDVIRVGRLIRVPTAALLQILVAGSPGQDSNGGERPVEGPLSASG
jgi:predicted DNA-binding transcriptional regulator AlpA